MLATALGLPAWLEASPTAAAVDTDSPPAGAVIVSGIEVRGNSRTRPEVVEREVLFAVGDVVTPEALAETERNLRALLFLGRVRVEPQAARAGSLRVIIHVEDRYARATSPLLDGDLEEVSYGLVAVDYNFLGRGQQVRVTGYDDAVRGIRLHGAYTDRRLRGSRLRLAAEAGWAEEGHSLGLSLSQPFYALATPWAYGAALSSHAERVRLYAGGALAARYDDRDDAGSVWLVRSFGDRTKVRPGLRIRVADQDFHAARRFVPGSPGGADTLYTYTPDDRRRVIPSVSVTLWRPRYVTDRFLHKLGPAEDLQVGSWMSLAAGASTRRLGSDTGYAYGAFTLAPRHRFASGWYAFGSLSGSSRWRAGRAWQVRTAAQALVYRRLRELPRQPTLAARIAFDRLDRPEDSGSQFLLGVDSGLRGVPPRQLDGRRRLVAGLELRPLLQQAREWNLAGALFTEVGSAWDRDPYWAPTAGAGLRLGLPRLYDTPLLRADVARDLRGGAWQLSFGLGQYY